MKANHTNHIDPLTTPGQSGLRRAALAIRNAWKDQVALQERLLDITRS